MEVKQKVNIHNRFDIEVHDAITGELKQTAHAENILMDYIYNRLCQFSSYFTTIHFGTGSGTPVATRTTGLFTFLGSKTVANVEKVKAFPTSYWKQKIVLNPEEYVSAVITEVGISWHPDPTTLSTHAMLKDAEGNPISITKTATDVITIYATVFITLGSNVPGVVWMGMPDNNKILNYLIDGSSVPNASLRMYEALGAMSAKSYSTTMVWSVDIPNKRRVVIPTRFAVDSGEGNAKVIQYDNVFAVSLPIPGVFEGQPYSAVPIGTGEGVTKKWKLPSRNISKPTVVAKVNGVTVPGCTISSEYATEIRMNPPVEPLGYVSVGVAMTPDAKTVIMGNATSGAMFISFDHISGIWTKRKDPANILLYPTGFAISDDGLVVAVSGQGAPYHRVFRWTGTDYTQDADLSGFPAINQTTKVTMSADGTVLAFGHTVAPFMTIFKWDGNAWVKRPDPVTSPTGQVVDIRMTPDGLVLVVAHTSSPYMSTYDWNGSAYIKRANPTSLPTGNPYAIGVTDDGLLVGYGGDSSPRFYSYDWNGSAYTRRPDIADVPPYNCKGIVFTADKNTVFIWHTDTVNYMRSFKWSGTAWIKQPYLASPVTADVKGIAITPDASQIIVSSLTNPFFQHWTTLNDDFVTFDSAPGVGQAITADYTVLGIHKTTQFVVDVGFTLQFGEGV